MKILTLLLMTCGIAAAQLKPESFDVDGHKAYLVTSPSPAKGKPWVWYAPNVKATCEVKVIPGRGHEISPAFFQCQELVDFILKHSAQP